MVARLVVAHRERQGEDSGTEDERSRWCQTEKTGKRACLKGSKDKEWGRKSLPEGTKTSNSKHLIHFSCVCVLFCFFLSFFSAPGCQLWLFVFWHTSSKDYTRLHTASNLSQVRTYTAPSVTAQQRSPKTYQRLFIILKLAKSKCFLQESESVCVKRAPQQLRWAGGTSGFKRDIFKPRKEQYTNDFPLLLLHSHVKFAFCNMWGIV